MKYFNVSVVGKSSLIMQNPAAFFGAKNSVRKIVPPEEEAERGLYLTKDKKFLCIPAANLQTMLIEAGARSPVQLPKVGNKRLRLREVMGARTLVTGDDAGGTRITLRTPRGKVLKASQYDLELARVNRPAGKPGKTVEIGRAEIPEWRLDFTIQADDEAIDEKTLRSVVKFGFESCGILSNRPSSPMKPGPHGRGEIVSWKSDRNNSKS